MQDIDGDDAGGRYVSLQDVVERYHHGMVGPQFVVIAGPNGAGKSTSAPLLLPEGMPYVNADDIAATLGPASPSREIAAGRLMLAELDRRATNGESFAVETTLASKTLASRIVRLQESGYSFHVIFLWLPSSELAIFRVSERVRSGGHTVPTETIRRRYTLGLQNFVRVYRPLADTWSVYDNEVPFNPTLIAAGSTSAEHVEDIYRWSLINEI